jgi:hypothetical protein
MGAMTLNRIGLVAGIAVLTLFVGGFLIAGPNDGATAVGVVVAIVGLIACGNLLYGARSPYAKADARTRPAQDAHDRAADLAAESRRATADAERRGERHCPLDPDTVRRSRQHG